MDKLNSNNSENNDTSKQLKNNNYEKVTDNLLSNNNSSMITNFNSDQIKISNKEDNKPLNNNLCGISNLSNDDPPTLNNNKNFGEIISNSCNSEEEEQKNIYAIEDQIPVSKYDEIKNPAMTFLFPLDDFQKRSIIRLEQNKNILVCAHTSSGKTLVAEYGIALSKRKNKKVIYTSPIKALSNQKYWEFKKKFEDVGIITGDVNINPKAQCLILTTEILHKCLYYQSDILNEVGTIIFDEVHYINDNERGHIWEEILIVLPNYISIIMLSATIRNYKEFALWIGKIKNTKVYIEITYKRVVPLQHFIYVDNDHIYKVKDKEEIINDIEIDKAFEYLKSRTKRAKNINKQEIKKENNNNENLFGQANSSDELEENEVNEINDSVSNNMEENNDIYNQNKEKNQKSKNKILQMIIYLFNNKLYPATLFVFNIEKIKMYSNMLIKDKILNNLAIISQEEKERINNFFDIAITNIPNKEKNIPQIEYIRQLLQYGLGVHHSGILPILKEIIEILYFKGLIKILFATTSFSIGLNMPTRTVVFTDLYKFNEKKNKMLTSNEYLQMSGRAGRRGVDKFGNVFIIYSRSQSKKEIEKIKNILKGEANNLESKFRLSYRIILSFYHKNLKNINDFFKESFHQSHNIEIKPEKLKEIDELELKIKKNNKIKCDKEQNSKERLFDIEDSPISNLICNINKLDSINQEINKSEKIIEYLKNNPGTILKIKNPNNSLINKFHKSELVFVINIIFLKNIKKLWCITITSYEENKNTNNTEINNEINEKEQIYFIEMKHKGRYKEYFYKYLTINTNDIIEIYEKPKVEINSLYKEKNKYFDIKDNKYFFKNDKKSVNLALKLFYRAIINSFPNKEMQIKPYKNKKYNQYLDRDAHILGYQKIIGAKKELNDIFQDKIKLFDQIKNNICEECEHYKKHLEHYNIIIATKQDIKNINNEIKKGEENETIKLLNCRLKLLNNRKFIKNDKDDNNKEAFNNDDDIEENKYDNYSLTLKGRTSLEILSNDNVLIAELIFSNIFFKEQNVLSDEIIVPFLSSFVANEKIRDLKPKINLDNKKDNEEFEYLISKFHNIYKNIIEIEKSCKLEENLYNRYFSFKYYYYIYSWMKGNSFSDICSNNEIEEGKLYYIIMRTYYFVDQIYNCFSLMKNEKMIKTFENIKITLLKGIMSVESLYLKDNINIDNI